MPVYVSISFLLAPNCISSPISKTLALLPKPDLQVLGSGNKLIFANKTKADIIYKREFENLPGKNFINILSGENTDGYTHGYIAEQFLHVNITNPEKWVYLCGPEPMMDAVEKTSYLKNRWLQTKITHPH